jgi:hypothetical protein
MNDTTESPCRQCARPTERLTLDDGRRVDRCEHCGWVQPVDAGRAPLDPGMLTIIEEHTPNGTRWGLSTRGPNPPEGYFVEVASRAEAERIVEAYRHGEMTPFLRAAGVVLPD